MNVTVDVSDPEELQPLADWLDGVAAIRTERQTISSPAVEERGDTALGLTDVLVALGSSSVLITLIQTIPAFLQSRRQSVTVTITRRGRTVELTAENVPDAESLVKRMLEE